MHAIGFWVDVIYHHIKSPLSGWLLGRKLIWNWQIISSPSSIKKKKNEGSIKAINISIRKKKKNLNPDDVLNTGPFIEMLA